MRIYGGDKLKAELGAMAKAIGSRPQVLRVGFLEGATYPDGTSVAMVAAIQNFGAPRAGIPPRPFFSNMVKERSPDWGKAIAKLLKSTGYDANKTLVLTGFAIKGQLQQAINDFEGVPLKPATIARKGFSKQLIDTDHMVNSADFEIDGA